MWAFQSADMNILSHKFACWTQSFGKYRLGICMSILVLVCNKWSSDILTSSNCHLNASINFWQGNRSRDIVGVMSSRRLNWDVKWPSECENISVTWLPWENLLTIVALAIRSWTIISFSVFLSISYHLLLPGDMATIAFVTLLARGISKLLDPHLSVQLSGSLRVLLWAYNSR